MYRSFKVYTVKTILPFVPFSFLDGMLPSLIPSPHVSQMASSTPFLSFSLQVLSTPSSLSLSLQFITKV
jgi:hypothetical protein